MEGREKKRTRPTMKKKSTHSLHVFICHLFCGLQLWPARVLQDESSNGGDTDIKEEVPAAAAAPKVKCKSEQWITWQ